MKTSWMIVTLALAAGTVAPAQPLRAGRIQMLCHRTAANDVPENTLESLEQAALLGCDVVEIDLRRTLDGKIVLNHDGVLERLTDGVGETESTYYADLELRDAGAWMGERFSGLRIALFEDALRMARAYNIRLILDLKTKGIGAQVLGILRQEGMLERVQFNGEWQDVKAIDPAATSAADGAVWVHPGVLAEQVKQYRDTGKAVIVNFSDNLHEMDLSAMKAAVAAGVDGINVDYPRLGADAVGRPVERALAALTAQADAGESEARSRAILQLARYRGFPLESDLLRWLQDADDHVSRAAAVALATQRPRPAANAFAEALRSPHADARANAAWALGELRTSAIMLLPLLHDRDPKVVRSGLLALAHATGEVSAAPLLPLLTDADPGVRGAAALALARFQPQAAVKAIPPQLRREIETATKAHVEYVQRGQPKLTQPEIDTIVGYFRCQIKMVQALASLQGAPVLRALEEQAFRPDLDFSRMNAPVAAFQLWDRIGEDPATAIEALRSSDAGVGDRAEWMLVQAGPEVLPKVRQLLAGQDDAARLRAIRIVAWQGDLASLPVLRAVPATHPADASEAAWAVAKITGLHPNRSTSSTD